MKMKMNHISAAALAALTLGFGFAPAASATPILNGASVSYNLNVTPLGTVGVNEATVTLTQRANAVDFLVTPAANYAFADTSGKHFVFAFDLASAFSAASVALTGVTSTNLVMSIMTGGPFEQTPFGKFTNALDFASNKGGGLSAEYSTPLTFTVSYANLGVDDFIRNGANGLTGYRFAADLGNLNTGSTGNVASSELAGGPNGNVPEPSTFALFGLGLLAAGALRRKA